VIATLFYLKFMSTNRIIFSSFFFILLVFISIYYINSKERGFLLYKSVSISINERKIPASVVSVDANFSSIYAIHDSTGRFLKIAKFVNPSKLISSMDEMYSEDELKAKKGLMYNLLYYDDSESLFTFTIYALYIMMIIYLISYAMDDYTFIRDLIRNRTKVPLSYYSEEELGKRLGDIMTCHNCSEGQKMRLTKETFQDSMQMIKLVCVKCGYEKDARVDKV